MRVLGIDPGLARTGWGVIEAKGQDFTAIDYGCITTNKKEDLPARLLFIFENLNSLVDKHSPDLIGIEQLFFAKNVKTAITVGQSRGISVLVAGMHKIPMEEVTPLQVKSSIVGYGNATKKQVGIIIKNILGLSRIPRPDDVSDALAIAVASSIKRSFRAVIASSKKMEKGKFNDITT